MLVVDLGHPRRQRGRPILSHGAVPSHSGPISRNGPHHRLRSSANCRPITVRANAGRNRRRHAAGQLSISDWGRRRWRRCHGTGDQSTSVRLLELLVRVGVVVMMVVVTVVLAVVVLLLKRGRSPVVVPISSSGSSTTSRRKLGIDARRRGHRRRFSLITVTKRFATTRTFFLISSRLRFFLSPRDSNLQGQPAKITDSARRFFHF